MRPLPSEASLYVHIPFCNTICPFCDFTKLKSNPSIYQSYINACCDEIKSFSNTPSLSLVSIFFGGGTPSVLPISYLTQLIRVIEATFNISSLEEMTLEMNPEDVSSSYLKTLYDLGFTRLSLGVQTFNHDECLFLGRGHTVDQSYQALDAIKNYPFDLNIDLMFGLPNSSLDNLRYSLEKALYYDPNHISSYCLTIEPNTPFFKKQVSTASHDTEFAYYSFLIDFLKGQHFSHYEVSSFAKPNDECIHNKRYWQFNPYIGIGLGAHSFLSPYRYHNDTSLNTYIKSPTPSYFLPHFKPLSCEDLLKEHIIANLRIPSGITFDDYNTRYNIDFEQYFKTEIQSLVQQNLINKTPSGIQTTKKGLYLLDNVCLSFL